MSKMKILIIAGSVIAIGIIIYFIVKKMKPKDVVTGVANSKIQEAAVQSGIPASIASIVAAAPDSTAAMTSIGVNPVAAATIASGVSIDTSITGTDALLNNVDSQTNLITGETVYSQPSIIQPDAYGLKENADGSVSKLTAPGTWTVIG